jgi:hypothetical protein
MDSTVQKSDGTTTSEKNTSVSQGDATTSEENISEENTSVLQNNITTFQDGTISLFDKILEYDGVTCRIIIDNENVPWFSGADIASFLEYGDTTQAIKKSVEAIDKKSAIELIQFLDPVPANFQKNAIYINEVGLYCLVFSSKKVLARQFRMWVMRKVLPATFSRNPIKIHTQ